MSFAPGVFLVLSGDSRIRESLVFRVLERYRTTTVGKDVEACHALISRGQDWTGLVLDAPCSELMVEQMLALMDRCCPQVPVARVLPATGSAAGGEARASLAQLERTAADMARFAAYALVVETCGDVRIAHSLLEYATSARLTPRECEILSAAVAGIERADLLDELGITINTYKRQVRSVLQKCGEATLDRAAIGALRQAVLGSSSSHAHRDRRWQRRSCSRRPWRDRDVRP